MRVFLVSVWLTMVANMAHSGAWAREEGQFFIASASNVTLFDDIDDPMYYDPTFYAEYGLTPLVTLGAEYFTTERDTVQTGFVFARIPLGDTTGTDRFAASLAFGAEILPFEDPTPLVRGGLSWGRGLDNGWLAVDTSATYNRATELFIPKADFTWGHNLTDRWTVMFQLQTGRTKDDADYRKIESAVVFSVMDGMRITFGAIQPLNGDDPGALRLGLWQTF